MRVGYLGPPGTFAEEALIALIGDLEAHDAVPLPGVVDTFEAVRSGEVPQALVPIENSIEGSVTQTLDQLAFVKPTLFLQAEVVHRIKHHLVVREGVTMGEVRQVVSHPQATAQCQGFLRRALPGVPLAASHSTAEAVRLVSATDEPWAAIGTLRAADLYGAEVVADDIADVHDNHTRFVLLGQDEVAAEGPGRFRTSIVCLLDHDRPGALLAILQEFAMRAVNLSRLESRPAKTGLGRYVFFIDIEGSAQRDLPVSAAITAIEQQGVAEVLMLGAYGVNDPGG